MAVGKIVMLTTGWTVTVAEPMEVPFCMLVAVTVTVAGAGTIAGAM